MTDDYLDAEFTVDSTVDTDGDIVIEKIDTADGRLVELRYDATELDPEQWRDISNEEYRTYYFGGLKMITIFQPLRLYVRLSGAHLVLDSKGQSHYIAASFKHIKWVAREGTPNFIF